jgi:hypothetical protein
MFMRYYNKFDQFKLTKPLFGDFSFEPTFYLDFNSIPEKWRNIKLFTDRIVGSFNDSRIDFEIKHPWFKNAYLDNSILEVRTGKLNNYNKCLQSYQKLLYILQEYWLIPSSIPETKEWGFDGGCHINFDLKGYQNEISSDIESFLKNLVKFLNKYPSITWLTSTVYDNCSCSLKRKLGENFEKLRKGDVLTVETKKLRFDMTSNCYENDTYDKLEMRGFMMPRTIDEFHLHFDFCNTVIQYVKFITYKKQKIDKSHRPLKDYNFNNSRQEVKQVCGMIGFDFNKFLQTDKLQILKTRLSYGNAYKC